MKCWKSTVEKGMLEISLYSGIHRMWAISSELFENLCERG